MRMLAMLLFFPCHSMATCVPPLFSEVAKEYEVESELLYAIALTESGRHVNGIGFRVWPWALNLDGQPLYPDSKASAAKIVANALEKGNEKIAVGVFQIYWRYHKKLFDNNPMNALDLGANARAGARILKDFIETGDGLWMAVGYYHAGRSEKNRIAAKRYVQQVQRIYDKYVMGECHALSVG